SCSDIYTLSLHDALPIYTSDPYLYMRTTDDGRFLIGGEDEEFRNPEKRDQLLGEKSVKLEKDFKKVFEDKSFITDFTWAGTFGRSEEHTSELQSRENLVC